MPSADLVVRPSTDNRPVSDDLSADKRFLELTAIIRARTSGEKPDYARGQEIAEELLKTHGKNLQLGALNTEVLLHRQGFAGLRGGLGIVRDMLENHWDALYPTDVEQRRGRIAVFGSQNFAALVRLQPITRGKQRYTYWQYRQGEVSPEQFREELLETPSDFFPALRADLSACIGAVQAIDEISRTRFADDPPNLAVLEETLVSVLDAIDTLAPPSAEEKLAMSSATDDPQATAPEDDDLPGVPADDSPTVVALTQGAPVSASNADGVVLAAARALRQVNRRHPTAYLLSRALRWGELRAIADSFALDRALDAPSPERRSQLRTLYLDARWDALLDGAEEVMATTAGRGWLDVQFYVVRACESLGPSYDAARLAVLGALKALLSDLPALPSMTLMDTMPTASQETLAWISEIIQDGLHSDASGSRKRDPYAAARAEAATGTPERAVDLLSGELARATTGRARFLHQTQIASILVEKGLFAPAKPLLGQLIAHVEKYNLAEWEDPATVAEPFTLMIRCLDAKNEDQATRDQYYMKVCTLSPAQALRVTRT